MKRHAVGKLLLTRLLVATALVSDVVDWNESHLFNPDWPPHAIFHDVVLLGFLTAEGGESQALALKARERFTFMGGVGVWLVWRRALEPNLGLFIAMLIPCAFWAMFFIAAAFPGSSPAAHTNEPPPATLSSIPIYPNMAIATTIVPLS